MFSQLLEQLNFTLKEADLTIRDNNKILKQSRAKFNSQNDSDKFMTDPTKPYNPAFNFSKSERFKPIEKQQLKQTDISFVQSVYELPKQAIKTFSFQKGQRFLDKKKDQPNIVLNPNYDVVKVREVVIQKNNKIGAIIRKQSVKDLSKSNISQMTAASFSEVGPGKYFVQQQKIVRNVALSKQKRFKKEKNTYEDNPLFINQNQTKKRPPSCAVLKKKIEKNKKLISKQQQQQVRQRMKMIYWNSIDIEIDRLFKSKIGPVLKQKYFDIKKMTGVEKRCAMIMLLDRMNYMRGGLDINVEGTLEKPCAVQYRKSTPKPFVFSEVQPGPDYYYPQDDLTKPALVGFSFGKVDQTLKKPQFDNRDYEINDQFFKKGGNIIINPLPQEHRLTQQQVRALNRGPGFYDCLFSQVQKRDDIGVMKFVQITQKNARQNNCVDIKQVNDGVYFPNFNAIDPNIPTPLYKQNANVKPMHLPHKVLFPQHWLFYDGDLNKVRAQIAKNVLLAKNMSYKQYQKYSQKFKAFKQFIKNRQKIPDVGEYEVKYTQIDPHIQGFDLKKKSQKTLIQPIIKEEGEVDGDNLILNLPQDDKKLPNIDFSKMVGRFQNDQVNDQQPKIGDRLLIDPKKPQKKLPNIKFEKMAGRQDKNEEVGQEGPQGNVLILNPKSIQKHIAKIEFSKQVIRQQPNVNQQQEKEEIILNPKDNKKIKGFVQMGRHSSVRMIPLLRQKEKQKAQQNNDQNK